MVQNATTSSRDYHLSFVINTRMLENFANIVLYTDWSTAIRSSCADLAFSHFYEQLIEEFQSSFPVLKANTAKSAIKTQVTPDLMDRVKERNKLYHKMKRDLNTQNKENYQHVAKCHN